MKESMVDELRNFAVEHNIKASDLEVFMLKYNKEYLSVVLHNMRNAIDATISELEKELEERSE